MTTSNSSSHPVQQLVIQPRANLQGEITIPGDKSISHRSIILASIANGISEINHLSDAYDCIATMNAMRELGIEIVKERRQYRIHGNGSDALIAPEIPLHCQNSATTMRLLMGVLAAQTFQCELMGDASLQQRPMERIAVPLREMGVFIEMREGQFAPVIIRGSQDLTAIDYTLPVASAQLKSSILFAALHAEGDTSIYEPSITRDHSERLLPLFNVEVTRRSQTIHMKGRQTLQATEINIPGDFSTAAYFIVAALLADNADITLQQVNMNPTRVGLLHCLSLMGAELDVSPSYASHPHYWGHEQAADIRVRSMKSQGKKLQGIEIPPELIPLTIDELPILMIAAACADGETILHKAGELRHKESDRVRAMVQGLQQLGIDVTETKEGMHVKGGQLQGGTVDSFGDHRIAMAFAIAGLAATNEVIINNSACIANSVPQFVDLAFQLGFPMASSSIEKRSDS